MIYSGELRQISLDLFNQYAI